MATRMILKDLASVRRQSGPLQGTIAPTTASRLFKSKKSSQQAKAHNFDHLFNLETRLRQSATLKAAGADLTAGVISLATGRPSPEYYPLVNVAFESLQIRPKESQRDAAIDSSMMAHQSRSKGNLPNALPIALSYGYSQGSEANIRFLTEHTELVHNPPYSDWEVCMNIGSTSAIEHVLRMFCSRGDRILMDEYTYSGTLEAMKPLGLHAASIKMDGEGLMADDLEAVLANWDICRDGAPKPFLLYLIPTGQNPTGLTHSLQRRKDIYAVAERHGLLIIEDDPYYYLHYAHQMDEATCHSPAPSANLSTEDRYLHSLPRSYLSMDVSGRVIRLDSTSKIIAPGLRCGWMTANSNIIAKLISHHDVGIVSPSGLAQLAMENLLEHTWGHVGFVQWLMYLRDEYSQRSQIFARACENHLPRDVCSWQVPTAGMFFWVRIAWQKHPLVRGCGDVPTAGSFAAIEDLIFSRALRKGSLICKGSAFRSSFGDEKEMFLRLTFATASLEELAVAVQRLGDALREEFP